MSQQSGTPESPVQRRPASQALSRPAGLARETYDIFQAAVQRCRLPMVLTDPYLPDAPVIFCNQAFCELTGYAEHEVLGSNCRFLQGTLTDATTVRLLSDAVTSRTEITLEMWNYRKDGSAFWNAMFIGPVLDAEGRLLYFLGSQQDMTARREADEARARAQRMDTLGAMAAGIAHEFNNLMTVAVGNIEAVTQEPLTVRQAERLDRADWAARAAGRLTQQMLSFAQRQSLDADTVDINAVAGDFDRVLTQVAGAVRLTLALHPQPLLTRLDVGQLELALINLVRNAADAAAAGGSITISTRPAKGGPAVEIAVSDTGGGMSPEIARRVTEPFFTTKAPGRGTGLGLSMVQGFVQQSGGALAIDSVEGEGTTIRLLFPQLAGG